MKISIVHGVGINRHTRPSKLDGKMVTEYTTWFNMLNRCYSQKVKVSGGNYVYNDCLVSQKFLDYEYFYDWCNCQIGFGLDDYAMDKDILSSGNKCYSENTCVFVPRLINASIIKSNKSRGKFPIGVTFDKSSNSFVAQMSMYGKHVKLGRFQLLEDAFHKYKTEKERYMKNLADLYFDKIDKRVYDRLINYCVNIDD